MSTFSRREFLQTSLLLGAGLVSPTLPASSSTRKSLRAPRTAIVLGAGLSGLSAAWMLRRNNWNVVVLEARIRIGECDHSATQRAHAVRPYNRNYHAKPTIEYSKRVFFLV